MNIFLKKDNGDQLSGDMIINWVLRCDLAPVPRTVEFIVRIKDGIDKILKEGVSIWTGYENLEYRIIKTKIMKPSGVIQGSDEYAVMEVIALLKSCAPVAFRREKAVIAENKTLGQIYLACGANASIANDFRVSRFYSYVGSIPTFAIAAALQEECAALTVLNGKLSLVRLPDLFRQAPKSIMVDDEADTTESEFMLRHEIPAFFSVDNSGGIILGDYSRPRAVAFKPKSTQRVLKNMTKVLVQRKVVDSFLAQHTSSGDILRINGVDMVVITAAHYMSNVDGKITTNSKFWAGTLSV